MQKKLIALAVAGMASTAAFAQSNVTIYGDLKPSIDMLSVQGESGDRSGMGSNNSNIGFKGEEALGNGLKAIFQIESGVGIAGNRSSTSANDVPQGGTLGGRNTFVGLKGGFGEVTVGRRDTAYKSSTGSYDPFSDTIGDYNNIMGSGIGGSSGHFDARADSSVNYISPKFGGFSFAAAYALRADNATTAQDDNLLSLAASFDVGGLNLVGAYESQSGSASAGTQNREGWKLGAKYNFGPATIGAIYEELSTKDTSSERSRDAWYIFGTYTIGAFDLLASYADADNESGASAVASSGADTWNIGARYNLSKRTNVMAVYTDLNNGSGTFGYNLNLKGTGFGGANSDIDGFSLRLQHKF